MLVPVDEDVLEMPEPVLATGPTVEAPDDSLVSLVLAPAPDSVLLPIGEGVVAPAGLVCSLVFNSPLNPELESSVVAADGVVDSDADPEMVLPDSVLVAADGVVDREGEISEPSVDPIGPSVLARCTTSSVHGSEPSGRVTKDPEVNPLEVAGSHGLPVASEPSLVVGLSPPSVST